LQRRAVEGGAGQAAIVIPGPDQPPALVGLTPDIGFAGLALGIEGIELQVEIMLGGFARVDGAAETRAGAASSAGLRLFHPQAEEAMVTLCRVPPAPRTMPDLSCAGGPAKNHKSSWPGQAYAVTELSHLG
jgi:hypothetical protein